MYTKMQNQNENTTLSIVTDCGLLQHIEKAIKARVFPSEVVLEEDFEKKYREEIEQIAPFIELPVGKSYLMYNVQPIIKKGKSISYFAEFRTENDEHYKVWIPDTLLIDFKKLHVKECWMVHEGRKPIIKWPSLETYTFLDTKVSKIDYDVNGWVGDKLTRMYE